VGLNLQEEFKNIDLQSERLEQRFIKTMETLSKQPDKSIWLSSENRAEAKAIYRLLANDKLDREEILRTHRSSTIQRMLASEETILAIQDTTSLNYDKQRKMEGIGYIGEKTLGVNIHSCLAVTTEGLVLGLLSQSSYNREQASDKSRTHDSKRLRPLEEKESYRWVETLEKSMKDIPDTIPVVTVCDREGDMYELFDEASQNGQSFLIRIVQNRKTTANEKILNAIRAKPCDGRVKTRIPRDSRRGLAERDAILQIRYTTFEIQCPAKLAKYKHLKRAQQIHVVSIVEEQADDNTNPIEWFLMTNDPVESVEAAYEKARWYMQRWKIEQFHYVLKSGCKVEKLQERSMDKTTTLVCMYSIIAVAIMNITYAARLHPDLPCTVFFEEDEWKVLYRTANKTKKALEEPYTIANAVLYLSWLGGPRRSPSDGPPGLKTIWIGLDKLNTLLLYRECLL
jgi:hypothetical protein